MELDAEFVRLPLRFDAQCLAEEIAQFTERDWKKHPQGHAGNSALPLVAAGGDPNQDEVRGPMLPTPLLQRSPYLLQVLASFRTVVGRTRLMRIEGNGEATPHTDTNYYWMHRVRIHVPIVTFPEVDFLCGHTTVNMRAGECWIFDTWRPHNVLNRQPQARIHLVCDSVGTPDFWDLVARGERPGDPDFTRPGGAPCVAPDSSQVGNIDYEAVNVPIVMSPGEQQALVDWLLGQVTETKSNKPLADLRTELTRFQRQWRALWARFGAHGGGQTEYRAAIETLDARLKPWSKQFHLHNRSELIECLRQAIVRPALNFDLLGNSTAVPLHRPAAMTISPIIKPVKSLNTPTPRPEANDTKRFDRPIFIVSAPRSGSSLLFETLAKSPDLFTIGGESHVVIESLPQLGPERHAWESNRLSADDADPATIEQLQAGFWAELRDRDGKPPAAGHPVRFLEKTPKNALRIPFLRAVFPNARFIYLVREAHETISSILEAWRSGRFITYKLLPQGDGPWSLLLIPGWRQLVGQPLPQIAAAQWETTNRIILDDLEPLGPGAWCGVTYDQLVNDPQGTMERLCAFAEVGWDDDLSHQALPPSRHTLTPPNPRKWQRNSAEIAPQLPALKPIVQRIIAALGVENHEASRPAPVAAPSQAPHSGKEPATAAEASPLRSQHTTSLPRLLAQLNASLMISTYQAGQIVLARVDEQARLNTHFRSYPAPMGLAVDGGRLAIGTKQQVWTLRNQPDLGRSLDPRLDACFATRAMHVTGDIRIHEIAWCQDELWIVNTRFSCLCTLDTNYSFVPRWRPPFITAYAPEDRCHLNGLAVVQGRPAYCTALGATDTAGGWRENKPAGGIMIRVPDGQIVARGLSMPHSPRLYRDRLWFLNSGEGGLNVLDPQTGKHELVARLPGFTRGLDFCGDFAFVGLSQVRETAVFSGLPLTETSEERQCGVWVVDITSGKVVAFLRFSEQVQEIFAVQVLPGMRFPEIMVDDDRLSGAFILPDEALKEVPKHLRGLPT